jgi:hypothetical protein
VCGSAQQERKRISVNGAWMLVEQNSVVVRYSPDCYLDSFYG